MKTSNKLLFGLVGFIILALIGVNIGLKKKIVDNNSRNATTGTNQQNNAVQLKTDTVAIETSMPEKTNN